MVGVAKEAKKEAGTVPVRVGLSERRSWNSSRQTLNKPAFSGKGPVSLLADKSMKIQREVEKFASRGVPVRRLPARWTLSDSGDTVNWKNEGGISPESWLFAIEMLQVVEIDGGKKAVRVWRRQPSHAKRKLWACMEFSWVGVEPLKWLKLP